MSKIKLDNYVFYINSDKPYDVYKVVHITMSEEIVVIENLQTNIRITVSIKDLKLVKKEDAITLNSSTLSNAILEGQSLQSSIGTSTKFYNKPNKKRK